VTIVRTTSVRRISLRGDEMDAVRLVVRRVEPTRTVKMPVVVAVMNNVADVLHDGLVVEVCNYVGNESDGVGGESGAFDNPVVAFGDKFGHNSSGISSINVILNDGGCPVQRLVQTIKFN